MVEIKTDLVIVGAGVAGLWLTNLLKTMGYNCILLENNAVGSKQTINSQGMLHSGVKYALQGTVTADTKAIKDAPFLWQQALLNNSPIKLTKNCILADHQLLWSNNKLYSKDANFFVSKVLQSTVTQLMPDNFPEPFVTNKFNGSIYKLNETVLNLSNTLQELLDPIKEICIKTNSINLELELNDDSISKFSVDIQGERFLLSAKKYIFTAGEGIQQFATLFKNSPKMQTRPLNMVALKAKSLPMLYGHNIGLQQVPNLTISSHKTSDDHVIWHCGGKIAEDGVTLSTEQQIKAFQSTLKSIFPWMEFNNPEYSWGNFSINRAENLRADGKKPTHATWFPLNNVIFAWPTKLVLAPMMADDIVKYLQQNRSFDLKESSNKTNLDLLKKLPKPEIATPWWNSL